MGRQALGVRPPLDLMPGSRRFPPPWTIDEGSESFIIRDANGQALAYVYYEDETGRRMAMKRLTRDEARRIAAKLRRYRPSDAAAPRREPCEL